MIAYSVLAGRQKDLDSFHSFALPGLRRVMAPGDSLEVLSASSIHEGYALALLRAYAMEGSLGNVEALVLLHADAEILDEWFPRRLRNLLKREPDAAVVGVAGSSSCRDLLWWDEPGALGGCFHEEGQPYRYHTQGDHEAAVVDGVVLCLSPWALQNLNFDAETYESSPWYAYDCDISMAARRAGKKVFVMDTRVRHHTKGGVHDLPAFKAANDAFVRKWGLGGGQ